MVPCDNDNDTNNLGITTLDIDFNRIIIFIVAFVISISVHECAHAWTADRLGDRTPRYQGRVTLNPAAHLDPLGTLLLLTGVIFNAPVIGWGRPVMFNPLNLKNVRRDTMLIAAAGPFSNLLMAIIFSMIVRSAPSLPGLIPELLLSTIILNISLMFFNLIPVHPLDGGKIVSFFLPSDMAIKFDRFMYQWGFIGLFVVVFAMPGLLGLLVSQPAIWLVRLLIGT